MNRYLLFIITFFAAVTIYGNEKNVNSNQENASEAFRKMTKEEKAWRTIHVFSSKSKFKGCGKLSILDLRSKAAVFHHTPGENKFSGGMSMIYEVKEPANVLLRSNIGTGFWQFANITKALEATLYSGETIDMRKKGIFTIDIPFTSCKSYTGDQFTEGVHRLEKHQWFQVFDPDTNKWITSCNKIGRKYPASNLGSCSEIIENTYFTVGNLKNYKVKLDKVVSNWKPDGYVGAKLVLQDASGKVISLPGAQVNALITDSQGKEIEIKLHPKTVWEKQKLLGLSYHFIGEIPKNFKPNKIKIISEVTILEPNEKLVKKNLTRQITSATAPVVPRKTWLCQRKRKDLRTSSGKLKETRSLYIQPGYLRWWKLAKIAEKTVVLAKAGGFNVLHPTVYHNGYSYIKIPASNIYPSIKDDTFAVLVKESRKVGIEVQPAVSVTVRLYDSVRRQGFWEKHSSWITKNKQGKPGRYVDIHNPGYQKYVLNYIKNLVKSYPITGIQLDFIRSAEMCFCKHCQQSYHTETGHNLLDKRETSTQRYYDWQAKTVGDLVKRVRNIINVTKTGIRLTTWGRPDLRNSQGRRPDIWLNNGWIDGFYLGCYGSDPQQIMAYYRRFAAMTKYPKRVWPMFGNYAGLSYMTTPPPNKSAVVIKRSLLGDRLHGGIAARRAKVLLAPLKMFRNNLNLSTFGMFDMCYYTDETLKNTKKLLFPEPAVPYFP
jgi:Glycosyl hydrolase-like 10